MKTAWTATSLVGNKVVSRLRHLFAGRADPVRYWEQRAKQLQKRAVLNIHHLADDLEEITQTHWQCYDAVLAANVPARATRALDYGCGAGRFTDKLLAYAETVVGVDISPTLISLAAPHDGVAFAVVAPGRLSFPDDHFDIIFVNLVLGGILRDKDLAVTARELERVLKPGGLLLVAENTTPVEGVSHWKYRSAEQYVHLFQAAHLRNASSYVDAGETIAVLVGCKNVKKRINAVFFCGDTSPYGFAHLPPILKVFDLRAVVIADKARWGHFFETMSGGQDNPDISSLARKMVWWAKYTLEWYRRRWRLRRLLAPHGTELIEVYDVNADRFIDDIASRFADCAFLSAAYPQIFGERLLSALPSTPINFHPSLLPAFRGSHPHFWAIAKGAELGGLSAHYMTARVDEGDIIAQISFPIGSYYYSELYEKLVEETPSFVQSVAGALSEPQAAKKQDPEHASKFRNEREIHCRIFWGSMTADQILNLVRTERAYCFLRDKRFRIERAVLEHGNHNMTNLVVEPGAIVEISGAEIVVACTDGAFLRVLDWSHSRSAIHFSKHHDKPMVGEKFS
jgi:methionyl-tRNA formyltransferase/ubiquinone/menaquinone biosynthesis C-methylase UbiE